MTLHRHSFHTSASWLRHLFTIALLAVAGVAFSQARTSQLFNFDWRFHAGDIEGAEAVDYDDSGWRHVDLPHDFQI